MTDLVKYKMTKGTALFTVYVDLKDGKVYDSPKSEFLWGARQTDLEDLGYKFEVYSDKPTPLEAQVGGGHYKDWTIQPIEFIQANNLGFIEGCVIKYITRYKDKNGKEDLEKIKHYVDLLIDHHYGD